VRDKAGPLSNIGAGTALRFLQEGAFYKLQRNIHTASSEQVRKPIFRKALFQWRNYERWLGTLKDSLGDALIS
jgi:hypothetical protein